jgi:multicomponent Na+:H+ antiporter subunit F
MTTVNLAVALLLLTTLVAGLWRVLRGPTPADRMLAAQLFGTTAVASLLLLAQASDIAALRDVALVFALLAAVTVVAFVRRAWRVNANQDGTTAGAGNDVH